MARAHAANACVQSDSIKGLAQSIAKPAYHRLLTAEPALRRAVPTLIIAFLITICLGACVQVIDQNRQKRAAMKRDLAAIADVLAERIDRLASSSRRPQRHLRAAATDAARHDPVLGQCHRPPCDRHRRRPARARPAADRRRDRRDRGHARYHRRGAAAGRGGRALGRDRHHPSQRPERDGDPARDKGAARPGHRHPGKERSPLGIGRGAVDDAVRHHRLRGADPGLCLPLAINQGPRRRSDQRRGARPDRHRAQSRPLRPVGLGPVARADLLVAVDVHHARARQPQRPPDVRRGQRAGEIRRHRSVRDRRPVDLRRHRPHRPDLSHAAYRRPLDLAQGALRAEPWRQRRRAASDRHRRRHHRTEEPCRKDRRGRFAAARRDRDHSRSLRAVGRGRPPGAVQLALPAPAQAAGLRGDPGHVLRDRDRSGQHAGGSHPPAGKRRADAGRPHLRGPDRGRQLAAYQRAPHQGRRLRLGRHRHHPDQGARAEAGRQRSAAARLGDRFAALADRAGAPGHRTRRPRRKILRGKEPRRGSQPDQDRSFWPI